MSAKKVFFGNIPNLSNRYESMFVIDLDPDTPAAIVRSNTNAPCPWCVIHRLNNCYFRTREEAVKYCIDKGWLEEGFDHEA